MARRWILAVVLIIGLGLPCISTAGDFPALADAEAVLAAAVEVDAERFPDADAVYLLSAERVRYEPDGTYVSHAERWIRILTEKGRRDFSVFSFHFNDFYGEAEVPLAQIYRPGEDVRTIDVEAQSRVMISPDQMHKNIYDPRQKVLRLGIPDLEIGDIVRVRSVRRQIRTRMPETFGDIAVLEAPVPLLRAVYEVDAPAELPLVHRVIRNPIGEPLEHEERADGDGRILHRWEARNVPRLFEEPNMPDWWTVAQRVMVSTIPDWETVSRWYWELSLPRLESTTPEMADEVRRLTEGLEDRDARLEAIFRFVSRQVRYMGITTEEVAPGYEPRDVSVTFENRYGVCRDKAALLVAMLRLDGFEAFPVLMHVGPHRDKEVPLPFFNHAIVAVREPDGSYRLMEMTDETTREMFPAYLADKSYLVAAPEGDTLRVSPIPPADENKVWIETEADLDPSGRITARTVIRFEGMNDNLYRGHFAGRKPSERRRLFEGLVKRVYPAATVTGFELVPADMQDAGATVEAMIEWTAGGVLTPAGPFALLAPPWMGHRVGMINFILRDAGLRERRFPFRTNYACGVAERFSLRLPDGALSLRTVPDDLQVELDTMDWSRSWESEDGVLSAASMFRLHAPEFSPKEYIELRRALGEIRLAERAWPAVDGMPDPGAAEADAHIGSRKTHVEWEPDGAWTITQDLSKTVLTYAGLKDHSEIIVPFNPAWEEVELVDARVTAPDGSVAEVHESEMNIMDEPWVASAPRYPPGRILVVNLPGVRTGSRIDYTLRRRAFGRPFFHYRKAFGGTEPADRVELSVAAPAEAALATRVVADDGRLVADQSRRESDGHTVRTWVAASPPAGVVEDHLPPGWVLYPSVFLSNGSWSAYAKHIGDRLHALASEGEAAAEFALRLVDGVEDPLARIRRLRDAVVRRIRRAGPSFDALPLDALTPADRTLDDGYGHDADRAILLIAMLRAAGFEPEFSLVAGWSAEDPVSAPLLDLPQRDVFSRVLVTLVVDGERIWLNDADQYAEPGATANEGNIALFVVDGRMEMVRAAEQQASGRVREYDIRMDAAGGARVQVVRRYEGMAHASARRRFDEMTPEERRRYHQEAVTSISYLAEPDGDLEIDFGAYPGEVRFAAVVDRFAAPAGDGMAVPLPRGGPLLPFRADRRSQPVWSTSRSVEATMIRVTLPEGARVLRAPEALHWTAPGRVLEVTRSVRRDGQGEGPAVVLEEKVRRRPGLVDAVDYPALLEAGRLLDHPAERVVLFTDRADP